MAPAAWTAWAPRERSAPPTAAPSCGHAAGQGAWESLAGTNPWEWEEFLGMGGIPENSRGRNSREFPPRENPGIAGKARELPGKLGNSRREGMHSRELPGIHGNSWNGTLHAHQAAAHRRRRRRPHLWYTYSMGSCVASMSRQGLQAFLEASTREEKRVKSTPVQTWRGGGTADARL